MIEVLHCCSIPKGADSLPKKGHSHRGYRSSRFDPYLPYWSAGSNGWCCPVAAVNGRLGSPRLNRNRLFDDLVGTGEDRWRHRETERLGGFQIDQELELRRLINRNVARFGTVEDLVHVVCDASR